MSRLVTPLGTQGNRLLFGKSEVPVAPAEISDAVELYARQWGRHGKLEWVGGNWNCWLVRLSLMDNDPIRKAMQAGTMEEQYEDIPLQEWNQEKKRYQSLDIQQLGAEGVRKFLERGNSWSGRGEFKSTAEAIAKSRETQIEARDKARRDARDNARDRAMDNRRSLLGIPYHRVGIDLKEKRN